MATQSRPIRYARSRAVRFLMQVLWPAFGAAALTTGLVFAAIDPGTLTLFGSTLSGQPESAHAGGFLLFWALYAGACSITWWITRNDAQRAARSTGTAAASGAATGSATGSTPTPQRGDRA